MSNLNERDRVLVDVAGAGKTFKNGPEELVVFENLDMQIGAGTTVVISGESGSGKSTLLNLIGGLDRISSGRIRVADYELNSLKEGQLSAYRRKMIGFIFQFHYLLKEFTALENVMLPAFMSGVNRKEANEQAGALLEEVNLGGRVSHYPLQLSGGERQRVAVARSLILDPEVILADEPTGNLDEKNSRLVEDLLFSLVKTHGKTLILVTHDPYVRKRGDRSLRLESGRLADY
jgi:lipoprotein-releasing system ATP-binding protein